MMKQKGFTVIELLIATTVFSVVLLLLTTGILQIGRTYQKGVTQAQTLDTVRTITDDIAQSIQFSGGQVIAAVPDAPSGEHGICAGSRLYSFVRGTKLKGDGTNHVLIAETVANCVGATPRNFSTVNLGAGQVELLGKNMRLVNLAVAQDAANPRLFTVSVRAVYGDDDLLCSPSITGSCSSESVLPAAELQSRTDLTCKSFYHGSEFCAASELVTTVEKRI